MKLSKDEARFILDHLNYPTDNSKQENYYQMRLALRDYVNYYDEAPMFYKLIRRFRCLIRGHVFDVNALVWRYVYSAPGTFPDYKEYRCEACKKFAKKSSIGMDVNDC